MSTKTMFFLISCLAFAYFWLQYCMQ